MNNNLCIKRIVVEEVGAVEHLAVGLVQCHHVLFPSEYLNLQRWSLCHRMFFQSSQMQTNLISHVRSTPDKGSLSCDRHKGPDALINHHCFIGVGVLEDYVGDPETFNLDNEIKIFF